MKEPFLPIAIQSAIPHTRIMVRRCFCVFSRIATFLRIARRYRGPKPVLGYSRETSVTDPATGSSSLCCHSLANSIRFGWDLTYLSSALASPQLTYRRHAAQPLTALKSPSFGYNEPVSCLV